MRCGIFPVPTVAGAIALLAALLAPDTEALALTFDRFSVPLSDLRMEIGPAVVASDFGAPSVTVVASGVVVSPAQEWEALATGVETFSIRHREWRNLRLDVDCASGSVFRVDGDLGNLVAWQRALAGATCWRDALGARRIVALPNVSLSYRPSEKRPLIASGSQRNAIALSGAEGWEVEEPGVSFYRLRRREWGSDEFWEVDAARRTAKTAGGKRLDLAEGDANSAGSGVRVELVRNNAQKGTLTRKDPSGRKKPVVQPPFVQAWFMKQEEGAVPVLRSEAGAPDGKLRPPASRWREKEKEVFHRTLLEEPCDVLVVPFQVEGWAVDRIERALLTRYLSDEIARATGLRLPNPTLVARALGDGARAMPDEEIGRLAESVKAKTLITGFVGHDREEKMQVTIVVRERHGTQPFGEGSEPVRHTWKDIPFSDERLPSEAFLAILGDVVARIFPGATKPPAPAPTATADALPIPATLGDAAAGGKGPVQDAFTLQLLGLLVAGEGTVAESFFERSLVALRSVSPESPDYCVLKASAYAALQRRPAALAALGPPVSAEGQALEAFLNGDLPLLRERVAGIARPVPRLIARIRLNDLERSFGGDREAINREMRLLVGENPGLGEALVDRLEQHDQWAQPSSIQIKQEFDALFPVAGLRLEDLAAHSRATGQVPSEEDVDRAIFNHYHRALKGELFAPRGGASPVPGDALDVLFAAAQGAALKRIGGLINVAALFEDGLAALARYEGLYPDHLDFAYLKEAGLRLSAKPGGEAERQIEAEASTLAQKIYFWSDGQSPAAAVAARWVGWEHYALPSYDADYPRRPYWKLETLGDRRSLAGFAAVPAVRALPEATRHELKNALVSLAYTTTDLRILRDLYGKLVGLGLPAEARALLEANRRRFQGNAFWPDLLAQAAADDGEDHRARQVYEQAIADSPLSWDPYYELGNILIGEGDFAGASRTFLSYPLFREPERGDRVGLSHAAYGAALDLLFRGAVKESIPLLEICVGLGSGSGSEMGALAYLALLQGDFAESARHFRDRGNRYRHRLSYGIYARFLHAMGRHQEAEALFDSLQAGLEENGLWNAAVVGLRVAGKSDTEVAAWFRERPIGRAHLLYLNDGQPLVMAFLVDRGPNDHLPMFLSEREDAANLYTVWFAEGYRLLKEGRYGDAYRTLLTRLTAPAEESFPAYRYAFPALAWAGVRSGNADEVAALLRRYQDTMGKDFHYHLALALLEGGRGEAEGAVRELRKSRYSLDASYPPIDLSYPWYQLLEAAEWLQAASPRQSYVESIVQWSKICQQLYPTDAWTYTVEALHTSSPEDRIRALALGLHLDRNSQRLSGFSEADRQEARAWLRDNNPFAVKDRPRRIPGNTF